MRSDIEIAQAAHMLPISQISQRLGIPEDAVDMYGRYKAKISLDYVNSLADRPDIDGTRAQQPILGWALQPGDVVAFHMLALHAAGGVAPGQRRRVFSLRYLGDDARHAPRRWATSPDFPGLAEVLPAGAPMDHALFPLLVGGAA